MSGVSHDSPAEGMACKGVFRANRWLILRRCSQVSILMLFMAGPWFGIWIVKGNLNSSRMLDVLPLGDPFVFVQSLLAGHVPEMTAVAGALFVSGFYLVVGGRAYCAWCCPLNVVTDTAHWLRVRLGLTGGARLSRHLRLWLLGVVLLLSMLTGTIAWELMNPVSLLHRGLIFGMGAGWILILAVFLFDLLVSRRGWCGHVCPVGAFYGLIGTSSLLRVGAVRRDDCNNCMDCIAVCPEPQVLKAPLFGAAADAGPMVLSRDCTNCGRCIDVCSRHVFGFNTRFGLRTSNNGIIAEETRP